jgi:aromatic ring-opening dioxygenase catalytic subunit (LigB family)
MNLPMMPDAEGPPLADYMRSIGQLGPRPRALLVVSAHWEAPVFTVNRGAAPPMLYDYGGFPDEAYTYQWPAPGDPELGGRVLDLLRGAGLSTAEDRARGYDHGTFIPLMLAYPEADVPVVQVSLKRGLDPAEHLAMGRALAPLRDEGVLILGSGNSFHNLRAVFRGEASFEDVSEEFDAWLTDAITRPAAERDGALERWAEAPAARESHPREEHLIPLMVAAGAAGDDLGRVAWSGTMRGMRIAAHHFGA